MAIQATIQTQGGLTATNAYLRITDLNFKKIVGGDNNNKWQMTYEVACYVDADARNSNPEVKLYAPTVDWFKVVSDSEPSDPITVAYANLKTQSVVSNVSDLV